MTDALDHLDLRRLPPVEPVEPPARLSQTLLRHADTCMRAAYLYVRHHGGMPAHALDRGSAFHMAWAKMTLLLLEQYALDSGGQVDMAVDEGTGKLLLDEVLSEHPELTVPLPERDQLREMVSHIARGFPVNPAHVVAVERKFILQLGEHRVSGIIDLALIDGALGKIRDAKTQWDVPSQAEYEATFQGRLYAVMLVYGNPVSEVACSNCDGLGHTIQHHDGGDALVECDGCRGRKYVEQMDPPLGSHLQAIDVGEVFPRFLSCNACGGKDYAPDGSCSACGGAPGVSERNMILDRIEIDAIRGDIEDLCAKVTSAFETWEFPAIAGSHCKRCPCEPECPLPRKLRRFAGAITTEDEAREAAEWWHRNKDALDATKREIRSWCKGNQQGLRFGTDLVLEFAEVVRMDTNWEAIENGATRAAQYGEPFDITEHRRPRLGTDFKLRKLSEAELAAERQEAVE